MRRYLLENTNNTRDLGGYSISLGKYTKFEKFIRSDIIKSINEKELEFLKKINLNTVIDLRNKDEIKRKPNALKDHFNYYIVSLLGDKSPDNEHDIPNGYMNIIKNKETISQVFKIILNSKGCVLFNCNAGKDRTGVISMLLLLLKEVPETDIINDYSVSYNNIRDFVRTIHKNNKDLPAFLGTSKMEYMEETLKLFKNEFQTIDNYFDYLGFSKKEIDSLKNKF